MSPSLCESPLPSSSRFSSLDKSTFLCKAMISEAALFGEDKWEGDLRGEVLGDNLSFSKFTL